MSRELLSRLFPVALVCLLLSFGCSDRSTDAPAALTVSGTLLDPVTLNAIPAATVSVIDADKGDILAQTVTAQNGTFRADQLPRVRLYVLVEADGYQVTDQTVYD